MSYINKESKVSYIGPFIIFVLLPIWIIYKIIKGIFFPSKNRWGQKYEKIYPDDYNRDTKHTKYKGRDFLREHLNK